MVAGALARLRVPLGFLSGVVAYWLARPTPGSIALGMSIAATGELLRIWAAGHLDKGREITRSGPYRFVRHPLYLGSALMGVGLTVAARSWPVAVLVIMYLALTYGAAIRTEEAALDARFAGAYAEYRAGRAGPVMKRFRWSRVRANREYRAVAGLLIAATLLYLRARS
jgi:protein-S-isoprenylcysteine O-methyltransferase Ste14